MYSLSAYVGKMRPVTSGMQVGAMLPQKNLDEPAGNLQNVICRHADQLGRKRATPYRIHVFPLLKLRLWK